MLSRVRKRKPLYSLTPIHLSSIFSTHHETFQGLCYTSLLSSICFFYIWNSLPLQKFFFSLSAEPNFSQLSFFFSLQICLKAREYLSCFCFALPDWNLLFNVIVSISFVQIGKHIAKESTLCVHVFTWEKSYFYWFWLVFLSH